MQTQLKRGDRPVERGRRAGVVPLAGLAVLLFLAAAELTLRLTGLDRRAAAEAAFFVDGEGHGLLMPSPDPELRYELRPGLESPAVCMGPECPMSTNSLGARSPERPRQKAPGTYRILVLGGSPIFGMAVGDRETVPHYLEVALNRSAAPGRRYEAWNLGAAAYTFADMLRLGLRRTRDLDPDLVLVQYYNVATRRAFLAPAPGREQQAAEEIWAVWEGDDVYIRENLPAPDFLPEPAHFWLLRHVALHRTAVGLYYTVFAQDLYAFQLRLRRPPDLSPLCGQVAELRRAVARQGARLAFFTLPVQPSSPNLPCLLVPGESLISVYQAGREREYYEAHPHPRINDERGRALAAALQARGLLEARVRY